MEESNSCHGHELRTRLAFEALMTDISARFINLPCEQIDSMIEDAQRCVCECLGLDVSSLWLWSSDRPELMTVTHLFSPPEGPTMPEQIDAQESLPWVLQKILAGETLLLSTENMAPEAAVDKATRQFFGVKSSVVIPLSVGGGPVIGVLSFDTLKEDRAWSEEIVQRLTLVTQIFTNALARKQSENTLKQSEARLRLAAESSGTGFWELDFNDDIFWATEQARDLFGYNSEETISMERFEASIYPEDRTSVRQAINLAITGGEPINIEYRILDKAGCLKWISSHGQPYFDPTGKPDRLLGLSRDISDQKHSENILKEQLQEIETLKTQLQDENLYLKKELGSGHNFNNIIGESNALKSVIFAAKQVSPTDATVLILGETGTGKGMVADIIHQMSGRKDQPFVTVDCSALPPNLIESELFGREKGAFTGAHERQTGRFDVADSGTIFLDEIGEIPLEIQPKLLRVLQEGKFERLGSAKTIHVNVRVIAATNRDLQQEVQEKRFREDLYYRVNVFPITIPPLRQRIEDIPLLAEYFTRKYARKMGKNIVSIPRATIKTFQEYHWPGNIRELEHMIERGVIMSPGRTFKLLDQLKNSPLLDSRKAPLMDLATTERAHILKVLRETGWKIEGLNGAATILKLNPSTLRFRMKKLGIQRPV